MAQILEFPYSRIKPEVVSGQALILKMPVRVNPYALAFAPLIFWMGVLNGKT